MFRRRHPKWQSSVGKRSLFRGRSRGSDIIHLPASTLKRTPAIHPQERMRHSLPPTPAASRGQRYRAGFRRRRHSIALALTNAVLACGIAFFWPVAMGTVDHSRNQIWGIDQEHVKQTLAEHMHDNMLPESLSFPALAGKRTQVYYNIDHTLQQAVVAELEKHRPDYGIVVAMDATTGHILAMADIRRDGESDGNLALRATYPAASVFKMVTAAAAIDMGKANAATVIPYNGKTTSLYKKDVLNHRDNKWTRHDSLSDSFSRSANTAFARLGIYTVGGPQLLEYSERFLFNHPLDADIPLQISTMALEPGEEWSIAETASGYTRGTNMSPVHGAALAATIANDGVMPPVRLIDAITDENGIILFESTVGEPKPVISADAAGEVRKLMRETVQSGSASKSFRGFSSKFKDVEVGGKTGSLTGFQPEGKYEWFVGYATDGERKIAYAVLCINKEYWYVKSAYLARRLIESYFTSSG